jgi:hypothetical protein
MYLQSVTLEFYLQYHRYVSASVACKHMIVVLVGAQPGDPKSFMTRWMGTVVRTAQEDEREQGACFS